MRHFRNKNYLIQDDYATVHSSYATHGKQKTKLNDLHDNPNLKI